MDLKDVFTVLILLAVLNFPITIAVIIAIIQVIFSNAIEAHKETEKTNNACKNKSFHKKQLMKEWLEN